MAAIMTQQADPGNLSNDSAWPAARRRMAVR